MNTNLHHDHDRCDRCGQHDPVGDLLEFVGFTCQAAAVVLLAVTIGLAMGWGTVLIGVVAFAFGCVVGWIAEQDAVFAERRRNLR